jgi:hypothetical protein
MNPRAVSPESFLAAARLVRQSLYWEKKDLASYVVVATHLLDTALANAKGSSGGAEFFMARSLGLSYDIASFTWPGWNEPGVIVTPTLLAAGLEAARLNFNLAQEVQSPEGVRKAAHFILGAQLLAAGEPAEAIRIWSTSPDEQGNHPWVLLAKVVRGDDPGELDRVLLDLQWQGGEAEEMSKQIQTARSVFVHQVNRAGDDA